MVIETVVTPPTKGAARTYDVTWPAQISASAIDAANFGVPAGMTRQGAAATVNSNSSSTTSSGAATPTAKWRAGAGFNGRLAAEFKPSTGGAGTGIFYTIDNMILFPSMTSAGQGDASNTDDWSCFRCVGIMALGSQASYSGDSGLEWSVSNVGGFGVKDQGAAGFGFAQASDTTVAFIKRQVIGGGAPEFSSVVLNSTAADLQKWHSYEIRVIGATTTSNGLLKVFVDGIQKLSLDWVTNNLPTPAWSNGQYGLVTTIQARGAGAANGSVAINRVRFMAGPDEASLL